MVSDSLHKEFRLVHPESIANLNRFILANNSEKSPLRVIVTDEDADRLDDQIAYYFGVIIKSVAEQAWIGRKQFDKKVWHEYFAEKFLPNIEIELPDGKIIQRRQSVARGKIGVRAMAKYTTEVEVYAQQELGVQLPAQMEN